MAIIMQRLKDVISAVSEKTKIDVFHLISIWKCVGYLPYKATHNILCVTCLPVNEKHTHAELAKKIQPPCSFVFSMTVCHESVKVHRGHHHAQFEQSHLHSLQGKATINGVFQGWLDELSSFHKPT